MSLTGGPSIKALLHDLVESLQHKLDKLALGQRKQVDFLIVPKDRTLEFENRYPILEESGIYLLGPDITIQNHVGEPEDWDKDGTIASFSAGSDIAELRSFLLTAKDEKGEQRKRRGKAKKQDGKKDPLPPPPPDTLTQEFGPVRLREVESGEYLTAMLKTRGQSGEYHRWTTGAGGRHYWKGCPVTTRTVDGDDVGVEEFLGPLAKALQLAKEQNEAGLRELLDAVKTDEKSTTDRVKKKTVKGTSDLRRYTINVSPALARAMALLLEHGVEEEKVRDLMVAAAPLVAAEFEKVTGRKAVGVSIHFDSNLPHWNIWHTGLEPVKYKVRKSERTRYRRTAMDLNASGNMLAWDRAARAFERVGEDLGKISPATKKELEKAEKRAVERQNRPPGDFTLNRKADEVLEANLKDMKVAGLELVALIDRGFREYVDNEKKRYAAAIAGRDPKDAKKMIDLLDVNPGETPLEATRRLVDEREEKSQQISKLETEKDNLKQENEQLQTRVESLAELLAHSNLTDHDEPDSDEKLTEILAPVPGESMELAAKRVVEENENLRNEIAPLRRVAELFERLLQSLTKKSISLGKEALGILKEIAELLGKKFPSKTKEDKTTEM
jgi:hypothetical protein